MNELLSMVAKRLVDEPDKVEVIEEESNGITTLRLKVAPDDMGKVIGKQGRIARAIRTLVKAAAINEEKKVNVEII
ncbi:MAG: KH domain-containing protein [Defluviitaleaceae bacterium]|nr:KH domain-containing protein [Defluviitaleaceae bacterium]